jgi:hypothetical protein
MNKSFDSIILEQKRKDKTEDQLFMENHYKELLQHCFLFALSKVDFFSHAAFHGGTCLRIIDNIDRFSEDLDFIQTSSNTTTKNLADLMDEAVVYLKKMGLELEITHNNINNNVQKIWIKEGNLVKRFLDNNPKFVIQGAKSKIKIEIDNDPPDGSILSEVSLKFPEEFKITIQDHSSSFSGKLHAVLCRNFLMGETTYIKGRDYFDLDWYLTNGVQPNYTLLKNALFKAGPFENQELQIDNNWLKNELKNKLKDLDWNLAKSDMSNFLLERSLDDLDIVFNSGSMIQKTETL